MGHTGYELLKYSCTFINLFNNNFINHLTNNGNIYKFMILVFH